ncbi:MAG: ImmA/IrrE family metallo-endopeptidase [Candidatus Delongbacteria bacterium]|nr:ImmA/IrrE family metallo-endopeptidase [Candidatus Delongbacteria bacterium]
MTLIKRHKLKSLDSFVNQLSKGIPFIDWAESIALSLIDKTSKGRKIVDLNQILEYRNVFLHSANENIYKAILINNKDNFDLYLNNNKIFNDNEKRFIIAHEIAHTYFYQDQSNGLEKIASISFGSREVENICDYVALCILLPKSFINEDIGQYRLENNNLKKRNEHYLKFMFHLSAKYQVDWHYLAYRLINIFNFLPNCLCIEFVRKTGWKISWTFQSQGLIDRKLFIPVKYKSEGKSPSARKSFEIILNELLERQENYGYIIVNKDHFNSYYPGNLRQFINKYYTNEFDKLKIYYRINHKDNILLLFPFDGLLKN